VIDVIETELAVGRSCAWLRLCAVELDREQRGRPAGPVTVAGPRSHGERPYVDCGVRADVAGAGRQLARWASATTVYVSAGAGRGSLVTPGCR